MHAPFRRQQKRKMDRGGAGCQYILESVILIFYHTIPVDSIFTVRQVSRFWRCK